MPSTFLTDVLACSANRSGSQNAFGYQPSTANEQGRKLVLDHVQHAVHDLHQAVQEQSPAACKVYNRPHFEAAVPV